MAYPDLQLVDTCLRHSSSSSRLYTWNQRFNFVHSRNKVCIERDGALCQATVQPNPKTENGVYFQDYTSIVVSSQAYCAKDLKQGGIEMMLARKPAIPVDHMANKIY